MHKEKYSHTIFLDENKLGHINDLGEKSSIYRTS